MGVEMMDRASTLERLRSETFDLLVIGAGIVGARVAFEAARAGANVALLDRGDFGGATSSASSKLIHGGLRYLQLRDFGLVREAHAERRALLHRVAPHLVRPLTLVLPVYRGGPHSVAAVSAALLTYATLSGFRDAHLGMAGVEKAQSLVPSLKADGLAAAAIYEDAQTHDGRLVLATVTAAALAGAAVLNYAPVTELEIAGGQVVGARVGDLRVRCRWAVNATGPWVDGVRRLEDPWAQPIARLSKGVHLVLEQPEPWRAALTAPVDDTRVTFAIPWQGMLLLGTTDTEYEGDPGGVAVEPSDVETVLGEASVALPRELLGREGLRYAFAGLRVLPRGEESTARTPRSDLVAVGPAGLVSVAGGKLTTHRQIALRVLRHVEAFRRVRLGDDPLPGAGPLPPRPAAVEPAVWEHLTHLYGSEAAEVAALGPEPVHPAGPDVWGQVHHAVQREWATTVEDVVQRRTTLAVRGLATPAVRRAVAALLGSAVQEGRGGASPLRAS
jgi:glycerol-3-phosphate dehydrogenase